jgi:two-component system response regulator (stage 0 sporulation protein F)
MAKLLIIDDDQETCIYLQGFFAKRGCQVMTSFNGEEGILSFKKHKPDLVLLDVKMPGINGLEVLKEIKDKDKHTSVVMFTIAADDPTRKMAEELGADGFIRKPFNMDELEGTVSRMLSKLVS